MKFLSTVGCKYMSDENCTTTTHIRASQCEEEQGSEGSVLGVEE